MKTGTLIAISLGAGIPAVLILIGLIGLLIKFCMKRCQTRAWENINSLPKNFDSSEHGTNRRLSRSLSSETEPLVSPTGVPATTTNNNDLEGSSGHISVPIDENDIPPSQRAATNQPEHTLVQIQRDRLNKLKQEELNTRPTIIVNTGENEIQQALDRAQKEFEESV